MLYFSDTGKWHRSRALSLVAVPLTAALLATPALAAAGGKSTQGPAFPTARQIAQHEGTLGHSAQAPLPTARQVLMHEGRLAEGPRAATPSGATASGGEGEGALIAGVAGGSLILLAAGGFVVSRRVRSDRALQSGA